MWSLVIFIALLVMSLKSKTLFVDQYPDNLLVPIPAKFFTHPLDIYL